MTSGLKSADAPVQQRLESWKHIASHLNCNERTAKRWEVTRKLPVRRLPGARGGVFALVNEIEAWQMGLPVDVSAPLNQPASEIASDSAANPTEATGRLVATETLPAPEYRQEVAAKRTSAFEHLDHEDVGREETEFEEHEVSMPASVPLPALAANSGFRWQIVVGAALLLLVVNSLSRLHQSALASRRDVIQHTPSAEARELDLKGRFYWNKRTPQDLKFAMDTFQKAVALDPEYADAYAGLAECYGLSTEYASVSTAQAYPQMMAAAQKAVALDPNLATAHRALGFGMFYWNWDRAGASREFERSITLNPNDATTHHWYANVLLASQRFPEAMEEIEKARELDPAAPSILADRGLALSFSGRIVEAKEDWMQLEKTDPSYLPPHWYLAEHYLHVNDVPGYMAELKAIAAITNSTDDVARASLAQAAFARGRESAVVNELADFNAQLYGQHRIPAMKVAFAMAGAGRNQEALEYIRRGYQDRDQDFLILPDRNKFPALADTAEYQSMVAKSRLPYPQTASQFAAASVPTLRD